MSQDCLDDLCDALALGRLTIAELAGLSPRELDALFELGARQLEAGLDDAALTLFGALIALYPYAARYWRAYGIALHRAALYERSLAAYDAALLLQPDDATTAICRAEVLHHLGRRPEAHAAVASLAAGLASHTPPQSPLGRRIADLLAMLAPDTTAPPEPVRRALATSDGRSGSAPDAAESKPEAIDFTTADGRTLPLQHSRFVAPPDDRPAAERTLDDGADRFDSARVFIAAGDHFDPDDEMTARHWVGAKRPSPRRKKRPAAQGEITSTAVVPRRSHAAATRSADETPQPRREITQTAVVTRAALTGDKPEPMHDGPAAHTAIGRRRTGLGLLDEDTSVTPARPPR